MRSGRSSASPDRSLTGGRGVYRWGEHTGEVDLWIEGASEADVFADALAALAELFAEGTHGERERRDISVTAPDRATLLADFLAELLFLAETEDFVPERVAALELEDASLTAAVQGRRGRPRHLVKAVTYHGLEFAKADDVWRAHVVLDV